MFRGFIHQTLVYILKILLVDRNCFDEYDRHRWCQFFQVSILNQISLSVHPSELLSCRDINIGSLSWRTAEVFSMLLGDITLQAHLIQGLLILMSHGLHNISQEGLGIEKACKPNSGEHTEI